MDNVASGRVRIVEDLERWAEGFEAGWLRHLRETGKADWDLWHGPKNRIQPGGHGVDLSRSRLLLITSSGAYLRSAQEPFDAPNLYGDPSLRLFPASTPLNAIAFAHTHYDHKYVDADPQVLVPLRHLDAMVAEGRIGEMAPTVVSFSGYLPDARMAVETVAPAILEVAKAEKGARGAAGACLTDMLPVRRTGCKAPGTGGHRHDADKLEPWEHEECGAAAGDVHAAEGWLDAGAPARRCPM